MKRQVGLFLAVFAVVCSMHAWAQTDSGQTPSGSSDQTQSGSSDQSQGGSTDQSQSGSTDQSQNGSTDQSPSSTGPQVAYTHPEQLPPLTMLNEVTASTGIKLSATTGLLENYTSYVGSSSYWETLGTVLGGVHITQIRPTLVWDLAYNGGVSLTALTLPGSSNYTTLNQNARANILWQFAKRWQLAVKDSYIYTNDPFDPYLTRDSVPTFNDPNPVVYIPQAVTEENVGSVNLAYQMSQHDSLTFTGGESFQRFFNTALANYNSYSYSGGANYQHVFSARFSAGGGYSFTALDYGHGASRSGIQSMNGFASYQLNPTMYVTGFIGPEYTASKDIVPTACFPGFGCFGYHAAYQSQWSLGEGATFGWSGSRNALRLGFTHQVSNGGGFIGTVRLYQATANYRRPLTRKWDFLAGLSYNNSRSITQFSPGGFINALIGTVAFSRNISQSWNARMYYSAIHESYRYSSPQSSTVGINGVGITLQYSWGHSLGR
ncbi:MAG: hypothetical protein WBM04_07945 [Candidatus Korobacteraceae bacterium]